MKVVISSGHSLKVRGASCSKFQMDEVDQARIVTNQVSSYLKQLGVTVHTFHDNTSTTQSSNIGTIVKYHNSKVRDLDISVHFNAHKTTDKPMGVEVLYYSGTTKQIATDVSKAIANAGGFKDRGSKVRDNLGFLKRTHKPSILIEVCFVDSKADVELYNKNFDKICKAIAETISGKKLSSPKPTPSKVVSANESNSIYRLMTGTFNSKEQAEKIMAEIKEKFGIVVYLKEEK